MPFKYSVFTGFPYEEIGQINYDSIDSNNLLASNSVDRRLAKHNYGRDFQTFQDFIRDTRVQSATTALNQTTFSCWLWFNSDVPMGDCALLARGQWGTPIWSIRILCGKIAFEMGDGLGASQSIMGPTVAQGDHFVAVSYDDATGEAILYYDGSIVATGENPVLMPTNDIGIAYGSYVDGGLPFNGWMDSALWTELILDKDILDIIYNGGLGRDIIWFFILDELGDIHCIFRNKILPIFRSEIEECLYRDRVDVNIRPEIEPILREKIRTLKAKKSVRR